MGRPQAEATAHPPESDRAPAEAKNRRLDQAFASLPGAIHTTQVSNPSPTEFILPLALFSPPGSRLLQQLIDYDLLVRRTRLPAPRPYHPGGEARFHCHHPTANAPVFSFVNRFRTTGVTCADVRANSPAGAVDGA